MSNNNLVLFGERAAGVFLLSEMYNPDVDGDINTASGKYVPAVGSQIIDNTTGLHNTLYTVTCVNPVTYKATLVPSRIVNTSAAEVDRIMSYGNDLYMAYFAKVTITNNFNQEVSLTKIMIDAKLAFVGVNSAEYELVRTDAQGVETIISVNYNSENQASGSRILIAETTMPGIRKCNPSYSYQDLTEGEVLSLNVYDAAGILIAVIKLIAKKATVLSELDNSTNPIVNFDATANQMLEGDFYLFVNQRVTDLNIYPSLFYADDTSEIVTINNMHSFCYGLEDVSSKYAGQVFTILLKYYIGADVPSEINEGEGDVKFVTCTKKIRIVYNFDYKISKISVVPMWNNATSTWKLTFYIYKASRDELTIMNVPGITLDGFDGSSVAFNTQQELTINTTQTNGDTIENYTQTVFFEGRNPNDEYTGYILAPTSDAGIHEIYGSNVLPKRRPVIKFNTATSTFAIPPASFDTESKFLENFYFNAMPPFLEHEETIAPTPTHFTLRAAASGKMHLAGPIAVENYANNLNLINYIGEPTQFVNTTLVMEFLRETETSGVYETLYGVPVDVK